MATFTYKARNRRGEILQDQVEGMDRMAVASRLRQQGLLVIDVKEQGVAQKDILEPFKRVKSADLVVFTRQFATMINAGLPVVRALHVLSAQTENPKLTEVVVAVRKDVEAGLAPSRRRWRSTPRCFRGSTSRWSGPARSGASSTGCSCA